MKFILKILALTVIVGAFSFMPYRGTQPEVHLPDYTEYTYNPTDSVITITNNIDMYQARQLIQYLVNIKDVKKPLLVIIHSNGGEIAAAAHIVTALKNYKRKVVVYAVKASSAAAYISQQFKDVYCSEFAQFMFHHMRQNSPETLQAGQQAEDYVDDMNRNSYMFINSSFRRVSAGYWPRLYEYVKRERKIYRDEAVQLNLCNGIMYPRYTTLAE
jgi:ATP-dependent protease ClpP protease subunit